MISFVLIHSSYDKRSTHLGWVVTEFFVTLRVPNFNMTGLTLIF